MSKILNNFPLFPVGVIVLPGEIQPLHVFEPRYKQLIGEMKGSGKVFGIPFVKDGEMCEYGSAVVLHKILATSPSGEMDVLVRGVYLFRIKEIMEQLPDKLYGGGSVEVLDEMNRSVSEKLSLKYREYKTQLASINSQKISEEINEQPNHVLDIAGQLPLDIEEKYEMIKTPAPEKQEQLLLEKLEFLLMINKKLEEVGYRFYLN